MLYLFIILDNVLTVTVIISIFVFNVINYIQFVSMSFSVDSTLAS